MRRFIKKPEARIVVIPGVGRVDAGRVLEGDEFAKFVPSMLVELLDEPVRPVLVPPPPPAPMLDEVPKPSQPVLLDGRPSDPPQKPLQEAPVPSPAPPKVEALKPAPKPVPAPSKKPTPSKK